MGISKSFKQEFSFEERLEESENITAKYPDRIPLPSCMDSVYEKYKDDDGFLYMCYSREKTFG